LLLLFKENVSLKYTHTLQTKKLHMRKTNFFVWKPYSIFWKL